ncbi:Ste/ste7 protein kinase, partial [Globisporangium splendens]
MKTVHAGEAKPQAGVSKLREPSDSKLPTRTAGPKDEKRTASHTDDAVDLKASRPSSGGSAVLKESKLKQPEVRPKILEKSRTPASSSSPSTTAASTSGTGSKAVGSSGDHPTKKVPPPPDKHSESSSKFSRAESKQSDTSLHKVRNVQSLANEIRRIRSLKTNDADVKAGEVKARKPEKSRARDPRSSWRSPKSSGTFDAVGFQIKQSGITRFPDRMPGQQPSNAKKHLVKLGVLGRGASGVVHKALHVPSLLLVAVKVIPVFENEKRHQLIAELKALYNNLSTLSDDAVDRKTVACPEIVCLYDAFMNPKEGNVSIVVECMDGGSLQDIVDTGGCKSESVLANISYRVLRGLQFLHSTYQLHRDIKLSNLLISHFGDVKISDFGIVREMKTRCEFSDLFRDFLDKCLKRDQSERWSVKQLLNHGFVQHCARQSASPSLAASPDDDAVEWGAKDAGSDDESKEQLEVDDIVLKVTEYCMKDAKELITKNGYTLDDIVTWIQNLPMMQKAKLVRFADQIGANHRAVYTKFQVAMNDVLQEIQETYFDDQKHQAK